MSTADWMDRRELLLARVRRCHDDVVLLERRLAVARHRRALVALEATEGTPLSQRQLAEMLGLTGNAIRGWVESAKQAATVAAPTNGGDA